MLHRHCFVRAATGLLAVGLAVNAAGQTLSPVPQEDITKLEGMIGSKLTAKPAKARRILVFWRCEGFVHQKGLDYGNKALEIAAEKAKAFKVDFSNDYAALKPENLAKYDALVLNNTTGLKTQPPDFGFVENALVNFVRSGKGIAVIHAGADNFNQAVTAQEMVGGHFWGHPWGGGGTWAFKLDDPKHPLNASFNSKNFTFGDEIYEQSSPAYLRAKLRVLVSLDLTDEATGKAGGQKRPDKDFAVSWIRPYGKGRVFYTSFGHDQRAFMDKAVLSHILNGVQYATGDLVVDDTPAGMTDADVAQIKTATLQTHNEVYGTLQNLIINTHNEKVNAANKAKIEAVLNDASLTPYAKRVVLRLMLSMGPPQNVKPVVDALPDLVTREWAIGVLVSDPRKEVDTILSALLPKADSALKCALIKALKHRSNSKAIVPSVKDADPAVATVALACLGQIADANALTVLCVKLSDPKLEAIRILALADCIGTLAERGLARTAKTVAQGIMADTAALPSLRAAAAKVLLTASPEYFETGMKDKCPMVRLALIKAATAVPISVLTTVLKTAIPEDQAAILVKLALRQATDSTPAIVEMLKSENEAVVCEALRALSKIGTARDVPAMYQQFKKEGAIASVANESLNDMRAKGVTQALMAIVQADPSQTGRVLGILGERMESSTIPEFEKYLKSDNADLRRDSWRAISKIVTEKNFPQLIAWLSLVKDEELNQAESCLRLVVKNTDPATRATSLASAWTKCNVPSKRLLTSLMQTYPDASFVNLLKQATTDENRDLRETALRALADWNDMTPYPILKDAMTTQTDPGLKTVALRCAVKLATAQAGKDARAHYIELLKSAPDDRSRMTVADALFKAEGFDFFTTLQGMFNEAPFSKKLYVEFFDKKIKGQATQPGGDLEPKLWKANASHNGHNAKTAFDKNLSTRWDTGTSSVPGMWYTLDVGENVFLAEIVLDTSPSAGDTPNGYEVFVSDDNKNWGGVVAKGDGNSAKDGKNTIALNAKGQYIKFVTTGGRSGLFWSIHEIAVKTGVDEKKVQAIQATAETLRQ